MKAVALVLVSAAAACAQAQERAEIERTPIVGNRELPKVLTIVPWKQPLPGVPSGKPLHSVLDETLQPLDRAVFRRQIDHGLQLRAVTQPPTKTTNAPAGETR